MLGKRDAGAIAAKKMRQKDQEKVNFLPVDEAKVDKPMIFGKDAARNERRFGKKGHFDPDSSGPPSERAADLQ